MVKNRFLHILAAWALGMVLCVGAMPVVAAAEEPGDEGVENVTYTTVTEGHTTWSAGHYEVTDEVTINSRVTANGDVYLRLNEGSHLTVIGGIGLNGESSNITIDNNSDIQQYGELTVTGVGLYNAGIGGGKDTPAGNITIHGGTVTVSGGQFGAGIGGGFASSVGKITIDGGAVNATGGQFGAGIGSGYNGSASYISISGGTVNVTGGQFGAGIGTGTSASVGTINISGGEIITNGGLQGAGIGSGFSNWNTSNVTAINITGGAVAAVGGFSAAGVGSGFCSACGSITINGGSVVAQAGEYSCSLGHGRSGFCESVDIAEAENGPAVIVVGTTNDPLDVSPIGASKIETKGASLITADEGGSQWSHDAIELPDKTIIPAGCTLKIPSGKKLVVPTTHQLTVNGSVEVEQGGALTLDDTGMLVVNGKVKVSDGGTLEMNGASPVNVYPGGVFEPGNIGDTRRTVTLDANGGDFVEGVSNTYYYWPNVATYLPTGYDMVRDGYVFAGWYKDEQFNDGPHPIAGMQVGGNDLTLYAKWDELLYEVATKVKDGGGKASSSVAKAGSGVSVKLTATPDEGYHFVEWEMSPDGVEVDQDDTFILPEANVIATAVFERHEAAEEYVSNEDTHWQLCADCGAILDKGDHTPSEKYHSDENYHWKECSACGRELQKSAHIASEKYSSDEGGHWKVCTTCNTELGKTAHTFEWIVDTPATETKPGSQHQECTECDRMGETEVIPPTGTDPEPGPDPTPDPDSDPTPGPTPKPDEEVSVVDPEGGSVEVEPAPEGETVTIIPTPDEGEEVRDVVVTDSEGNPVEVTENPDGSYEFTMPEGGATVEVIFGCDGGELCPCHAFSDLDSSAWYHDAVDWALTNGVFHGYGDGTFGPDDALAREQAATVLYNYLGGESGTPGCGMTDVADDLWYADAVNWAVANGVMTGYSGVSVFGIGDVLTREQFCSVIAKAMGVDLADVDTSVLDAFPDADGVSEWARTAVAWAVQEGVLNGVETDDGTRSLQAVRGLTRAEMAAMVKNAVDGGVLTK